MKTGRSERHFMVLIVGVVASGALVWLLGVSAAVRQGSAPELWNLGLAAVGFYVGDIALLHLRFGHDRHSFTWSETAIVIGLVLLPAPWLQIVAPVCVGAAHLQARRAPVKVAYNAASSVLGCLAAQLVFDAVNAGSGPAVPNTWVALAAGSLAFFLVNSLAITAAVARSQGLAIRRVFIKGLPLNGIVWLGNTATGVIVIAVAATKPEMLLVFPMLVALLWLGYRGYWRAMQERDVWEVLQATSRDLVRVDEEQVATLAIERAETLFRAEFVELMAVDGETGASARLFRRVNGRTDHLQSPISVAGSFWPRTYREREPFEMSVEDAPEWQRTELQSLGLAGCIVAPLLSPDGCLGTLRIGFRGKVRLAPRELQVFSTFANHVSTSLYNARLFESMKKDRAKLRGVLAHSSDGIFAVDAHGFVSSWNPAMESITGVSARAAVGMTLAEALVATHSGGDVVSWEWLEGRLAGQSPIDLSVSIDTVERGRRWLDLSVSAVPRQSILDDAVVIIARDETAAHELEATQQDFVATVSHELRTPLTPLKGFLWTLLRPNYEPSTTELREIHARMLGQVDRLERLVEDLLTTSQVEGGHFVTAVGPIVIDDVIDRLLPYYTRPCELSRGGRSAIALADAGRVEQVVSNLLSNADKYSPPSRPVRVSVERVVGSASSEIVVKVIDEGPGIAESEQAAVFERFRRLGDHNTRRIGGSGLGLYIARRLVEAMGGRIWVESVPGEGATFAFSLPAAIVLPGVPAGAPARREPASA